MNVSREVILDLLPLYLSDEASPDTRTLVEQQLAADPDLARLAAQWQQRLPQVPPPPVNPDAEALAYREAKRQLANRVVTLAAAIAAGVLAIGGAALFGALLLFFR
jgi:anti-sigma factor RsiW